MADGGQLLFFRETGGSGKYSLHFSRLLDAFGVPGQVNLHDSVLAWLRPAWRLAGACCGEADLTSDQDSSKMVMIVSEKFKI